MYRPISSVIWLTMSGSCASHAVVDRLLDPRRDALPQLRLLLAHRPVDDRRDLRLEQRHDVRRPSSRGSSCSKNSCRRAELRDRLVDRDDAHLRRPRRDDPLPADRPVHDPRDLLHPAREQRGELLQAGDPLAVEAHRVEQHDQPGPVDQPADRPGEERDRDQLDPVVCAQLRPLPLGTWERTLPRVGRRARSRRRRCSVAERLADFLAWRGQRRVERLEELGLLGRGDRAAARPSRGSCRPARRSAARSGPGGSRGTCRPGRASRAGAGGRRRRTRCSSRPPGLVAKANTGSSAPSRSGCRARAPRPRANVRWRRRGRSASRGCSRRARGCVSM